MEPSITPAPASPDPAPVAVPASLAEYRAQKVEAVKADADPAPIAPAPAPAPVADVEPPEPPEEGEGDEPVRALAPISENHRWKDPVTKARLDLRRKDHQRIKAELERGVDLQRQNDELLSRLQRLESQERPEPQGRPAQRPSAPDTEDPEPQLEQFADQADPYLAHQRALARWDARQEFKTLEARRSTVERTQRATAQVERWQQGFDSKAQSPEFRTRYPDFDAAHDALMAALPKDGRARPLVHRLLTSKSGHDLAYYLGSHPEALQALYRVPPHEHLMAIGALEARVTADAAKATAVPVPQKPPAPPMAPTSGTGTPTSFDPKTASLDQWRRHKKAG